MKANASRLARILDSSFWLAPLGEADSGTNDPAVSRKDLYLIFLAAGIVGIIALSVISQAHASIVVDSTSTSNPLGWSNQRRVFRNPRGSHAYYVFYALGTDADRVNYRYSTDGTSWTAGGAAFTTSGVKSASVTYIKDDTGNRLLVYLCGDFGVGSAGADKDLLFRIGEITDSSNPPTINWLISDQIVFNAGGNEGASACSIGVDNNGRIGIAYDQNLQTGGAATKNTHEARASLSSTTKPAGAPTWTQVTGLSDQTAAGLTSVSVFASITPVTGDSKPITGSTTSIHQFVVVSVNTNTGAHSAVHINWDGTTATTSTRTTSSAGLTAPKSMSCVSVSNGQLVCGYENNSALKSRRVTINSATPTSAPTLESEVSVSADNPEDDVGLSLTYQGNPYDDVWIFWALTTNVKAAYALNAESTTQTWSSPSTLETESTNAHGPRGAPEAFSSSSIGYTLYDSSSPAGVRWNLLTIVDPTVTVTSTTTTSTTTTSTSTSTSVTPTTTTTTSVSTSVTPTTTTLTSVSISSTQTTTTATSVSTSVTQTTTTTTTVSTSETQTTTTTTSISTSTTQTTTTTTPVSTTITTTTTSSTSITSTTTTTTSVSTSLTRTTTTTTTTSTTTSTSVGSTATVYVATTTTSSSTGSTTIVVYISTTSTSTGTGTVYVSTSTTSTSTGTATVFVSTTTTSSSTGTSTVTVYTVTTSTAVGSTATVYKATTTTQTIIIVGSTTITATSPTTITVGAPPAGQQAPVTSAAGLTALPLTLIMLGISVDINRYVRGKGGRRRARSRTIESLL